MLGFILFLFCLPAALAMLVVVAPFVILAPFVASVTATVAAVLPFIGGGFIVVLALGLVLYPFKNWIEKHNKILTYWSDRIGITLFVITVFYHIFYVW
ncbi:hypothetical protein [Lonepinella sp. BR2357]|uniref:hypothetical protein n=1 Tax=Lonepinella sp. BR2357 TaxID=3434549 RepID=UPI003F6E1AB3